MADNQEGSNFLTFTGGVILGSAIGTIVGLFLAPKSGNETRHQLSENMSDAQNKTKQILDDTKTSLSQGVDKASKNIESTVQKVTEAFNAGRKAAQDIVSENFSNGVADEKNSVKIDKTDVISGKLNKPENNHGSFETSDKANKKDLEAKVGEEKAKEDKADV
ncbi:MAG: YtxH domain-containing protein [Candidatus Sericytochromatia bacterium]|nr:YtxH domain-containing protein [Candidatus Sericytochromatia bacterium]